MIQAFLLLVALQLLGDALAAGLGVPVPGMVIGLALLAAVLAWRGRMLGPERAIPAPLAALATGLHANLGLLFVPAGVGILAHRDLLATEGGAILVAVVVSTALAVWVTAAIASRRGQAAITRVEEKG
jgi:putative effector of murein hydrolase LrgA (UPF0299 family)